MYMGSQNKTVMKNCDLSYARCISALNACIANLTLPTFIITFKHTFEEVVQIQYETCQ